MSGGRPVRVAAGLAVLFTLLLAVIAALVYLVLPRSGLTPAAHDWTAEWRTAPPVVSTLPGGLLETATVRMGEDFYKSDARTWWGIYLGNTVSHIQVQATYRYGVPLADDTWTIVTRGQTTVVIAPDLRPSLPVALDTSTWREKTASGWARFDKQDQLEALRRSISGDLEVRARDAARMALVLEASRRTIREYVENWLVARGDDEGGVFDTVKVYFLHETDAALLGQLREGRRALDP